MKHTQKETEKDKVKKKFEKLHKEDKKIQKLHEHLEKMGWKQKNEDKNFAGLETVSVSDDEGEQATTTLSFQDYQKDKSEKGACIGHVEVKTRNGTKSYSFALVAEESPTVLPDKITEYKISDDLIIEEANSWLNCVIDNIIKNVGSSIYGAFMGCAITAIVLGQVLGLGAFIVCIAVSVGVFFGIAVGCCACQCHWTCGWAVGCCYQ